MKKNKFIIKTLLKYNFNREEIYHKPLLDIILPKKERNRKEIKILYL